jgi:alpha-N-arabinofuranosidase
MKIKLYLIGAVTLGYLLPVQTTEAQTTYTINTSNVPHQLDEKIYGHFLEHIYHSVNNGLWGDLVWNRSFERITGSGGLWTIADSALVQSSLNENVRLLFGETGWGDYEITLQAQKSGGDEGFLIIFRASGENFYWANLGGWGNTQHAIEKGTPGVRWSVFNNLTSPGSVVNSVWYNVRIRCEGNHFQVWFNNSSLFNFTDNNAHLTGQVGVGTWRTQARYRNIMVTDIPSGDTLFDGIPDPGAEQEITFTNWEKIGNAALYSDTSALNSDYCAKIVNDSNKMAGIQQNQFNIIQQRYEGSFWAKGDMPGGITLRLLDNTTELATMDYAPVKEDWQEYYFELDPASATENGTLEITCQDSGVLYIDQVSMMGQNSLINDGYRPDLLQAVEGLRPPIIRWPGGCYVSAYFWKDGIGPQHSRVTYPIDLWDDKDVNSYGTDEFLRMCEKTGTEPLIVINTGLLDATCGVPITNKLTPDEYLKDALDWMEYCNGDKDTTSWGAVRAANGHPEPYNVRYWEIDNETWSAGISAYVNTVKKFAPAMKNKYPDIKIIACGSGGFDQNWNTNLLSGCAEQIDYISTHHYESISNYSTGDNSYESFLVQLENNITASSNPNVKIFMSEWNTSSTIDWRNGLYAGGMLNVFERQGEYFKIGAPALFLRHESAGGSWNNAFINFNNVTWFPAPNYVIMKLWHDHYAPNFLETQGSNAPLSVVSTMSEDSSIVYFKAINTASANAEVVLEFDTSFWPGSASVKQIVPPSLFSVNSYANPEAIKVTDGVATIVNGKVHFTAPANSAVVVSIENDPNHIFSSIPSLSYKIYLSSNSPNPFTKTTTIRFETEKPEHVRLTILDISGREVITLVDQNLQPGSHKVAWDGLNAGQISVGKGLYFYELSTPTGRVVKKMVKE